jgi:hypothetical protein
MFKLFASDSSIEQMNSCAHLQVQKREKKLVYHTQETTSRDEREKLTDGNG